MNISGSNEEMDAKNYRGDPFRRLQECSQNSGRYFSRKDVAPAGSRVAESDNYQIEILTSSSREQQRLPFGEAATRWNRFRVPLA